MKGASMNVMVGHRRTVDLQRLLRENAFDGLICLKPQNTYYLSGFNPIIYSHPVAVVLPVDGASALLVHALRDDHARSSAWVDDIRLHGKWAGKTTMSEDWLGALQAILEEKSLVDARIGIEADFLPIATMRMLETALPRATFGDASELIMAARMVKEPSELEAMRAAASMADAGMEVALDAAHAGATEQEVSTAAMAAMNRAWIGKFGNFEVADFGNLEGGIHNSLWCYCLTGDRVLMNCDNPTSRKLQAGELALIVIWTCCNGMHAENERAVAVGSAKPELKRMYEALLKIREDGLPAIKSGISCSELHTAVVAAYSRYGYGDYIPGRIGHGMGLGAHEHPSIGAGDTTVLRPGMVLTYEPSIRVPGLGGLQHSDTILLTDNGFEYLTKTRRDYITVSA